MCISGCLHFHVHSRTAYYSLSTVLSLYIDFSRQSHEADNLNHGSEKTEVQTGEVSCPEGTASRSQAVI